MKDIDKLIQNISSLQRKQQTLLIAIDGFGGSGKSTLANSLKEHLVNAVVVEMDDFYLPSLKRADYLRVNEQVIHPLSKNIPASYQRYDWKIDGLAEWHTIEPGGIVIVEGVFSTHPALADKYDYKIWVECSQEIGFQRGVERDKTRDKVDNTEKWLHLWMPSEKQYAEAHNPKKSADYIVDAT